MGYLDDVFNSVTNNRTPLVDLFNNILEQNAAAPTNVGPGFPASPLNANAAMPAPQNAPIQIGDYSMPRIGSGFLGDIPQHDPHTGETIQPAAPAAAPTNPFSAAFNRGADALASMSRGGSFLGAVRGTYDDPKSVQRQQLQQQLVALVNAGVPREQAMVAVLNPEAGKAILPQYLGADKFAFTTLPDGTVVRQNARTGEVAPAYQGGTKPTFGIVGENDGKKVYGWTDPTKRTVTPYQMSAGDNASGTITGPNGQPIAIPAGVDRKTFVNEISKINADAATGKMTEVQAKASSFAARMDQAESTLRALEGQGTSYLGSALDNAPLVGGTALTNSMQSAGYQRYRQAASNFVTAMLRQESGAAISNSEFDRYAKEMLPQPGDGAAVLAQKRAARAAAIEQMKRSAGPGYKSSATDTGTPLADPLGIR